MVPLVAIGTLVSVRSQVEACRLGVHWIVSNHEAFLTGHQST